jgi:hypothetical protein
MATTPADQKVMGSMSTGAQTVGSSDPNEDAVREALELRDGLRRLGVLNGLKSIKRNLDCEDDAVARDIAGHQEEEFGERPESDCKGEDMEIMAGRDVHYHLHGSETTTDTPKAEQPQQPAQPIQVAPVQVEPIKMEGTVSNKVEVEGKLQASDWWKFILPTAAAAALVGATLTALGIWLFSPKTPPKPSLDAEPGQIQPWTPPGWMPNE